MKTPGTGVSGYVLLLTIQFAFIAIFAVFTNYSDELRPKNGTQAEEGFIIPKYARKTDSNHDHHVILVLMFHLHNAQTFKIFTS